MNDNCSNRTAHTRTISRRAFLTASSIGILGLAGCADQSSDRQFAGDPRTEEAAIAEATQKPGRTAHASPTAVPTPLPIAQLLAPRGDQTRVIGTKLHTLVVVEVAEATGTVAWSNPKRSIWAAEIAPTSATVALLTSRSESPVDWAVAFVDAVSGETTIVEIGNWELADTQHPDAIAGGRGGIAWNPDSRSVVVALPTGGLLQVFPEGSQIRVAKAMVAKRPSAVAISADGSTIAFVDQPSGSDGSGVFAGSMKAKPVDPVTVLPADRSGNRYARGVGWVGSTARVTTIIDREELGHAQGDLFFLDTETRLPQLVWTSPAGRETASVESFAVSPDALVTAFLTNSITSRSLKPSSLWLKQTDGATIERFDLPVGLLSSRIAFTPDGVAVTGVVRDSANAEELVAAFLIEPRGKISLLYQQEPAATPVASPRASPVASPQGTPSPIAVTDGG